VNLNSIQKLENHIKEKVKINTKQVIPDFSSISGKLKQKHTLPKIITCPNTLKKSESGVKMRCSAKQLNSKFNTPKTNTPKTKDKKIKFFNDPDIQNYKKKLYKKSTFISLAIEDF